MTQRPQCAAVEQFEREFPFLANCIAGILAEVEKCVPPHEAPRVVLTIHRGGPGCAKQYVPRPLQPGLRPEDYAPSIEGDLRTERGADR